MARRMPWSTSAMSWFVAFICSLCALSARLLSTPMASAEATSFFDLPSLVRYVTQGLTGNHVRTATVRSRGAARKEEEEGEAAMS